MLGLTGLKVEGVWEEYHTTAEENPTPSSTLGPPPTINGSESGGMR